MLRAAWADVDQPASHPVADFFVALPEAECHHAPPLITVSVRMVDGHTFRHGAMIVVGDGGREWAWVPAEIRGRSGRKTAWDGERGQ